MARSVLQSCVVAPHVQGYPSLIRKSPSPQDQHMTLGIVSLKGPRRGVFLVSKIPLYTDLASRFGNGIEGVGCES